MAEDWTYSGDPGDSTLDEVRFLCGQTSTGDDVLLTDGEVTYAIGKGANTFHAASLCANTLQARYSLEASDLKVGQTAVSYKERAERLGKLSISLQQRGLVAGVSPFAGGVSQSDKDSREADTDTVVPFAAIDDMDNQGTVYST